MSKEDIIKANKERTSHEAQENGRKGGIASGKARRDKKDLKEALEILLEQTHNVKIGSSGATKEMLGTDVIATALYNKASKGNTKAFELIRDTIGQKPVDKVEVDTIDRSESIEILKEIFDEE